MIFICLIALTLAQPILDSFPVTFQLEGLNTFTPNSGNAIIAGYGLTIGYVNHQWLAVEIIGTTSDILVVQQNPFYTFNANDSFSGHIVTMADYKLVNGSLTADVNTTEDLNSIGYMKNRVFSIRLKRALGSHSGQDWDASRFRYGVTQVCFYTSRSSFSTTNWRGDYSVCRHYEVTNLVSTYRGISLKTIKLNGYNVSMYGHIDGPVLNNNVFFYHPTPLYTYTVSPAVAIQLGATPSGSQDFNVFSLTSGETGDYYGQAIATMVKDTSTNGFQNSGLSATYQNTNVGAIDNNISGTVVKIAFSRNVTTFDQFDRQMLSTFPFCIYIFGQGSIRNSLTDKYCDVVELSYSFPRLEVEQGQSSNAFRLLVTLIFLLLL